MPCAHVHLYIGAREDADKPEGNDAAAANELAQPMEVKLPELIWSLLLLLALMQMKNILLWAIGSIW